MLLDANITYSFNRYSIGVHGKNLTNEIYKTAGYQYLTITPAGTYKPTLGKEGIATAFYGNPRQIFATFTAKF